ncbi:MAG TPA: dimethylargininase, partial [Rhodanobacteraceae bacterium]|nr:dimethylargininase [Rhodanobacteraceae bacterium]
MQTAITRDVSRSLGACELSYVERALIDVNLAERQHLAYRQALQSLGCRVIALAAEHELPDAVFVEDVALVFDEIAIRTRPGAVTRRAEVESVANALESYRAVRSIDAPGTLDGGDVLRIGRTIYIGRSARTNAAAMQQLGAFVSASALGGQGYAVQPVSIRDCLHLKSAITEVGDGVVLINPEWVDRAPFAHLRQIEIDP